LDDLFDFDFGEGFALDIPETHVTTGDRPVKSVVGWEMIDSTA